MMTSSECLAIRARLIPLARFLAAIIFYSELVASPTFAASKCENPQDFAMLAHCFLAQSPCLSNYFSIDAAPNYGEALKCFEAKQRWPFVVLMYLNGEGTKRDLKKAESVLKTRERIDPDAFGPHQAETLQKSIDECNRAPRLLCPKLEYCRDLDVTTPDMEICDAVQQVFEEAAFSRLLADTRKELRLGDRALFDQVIAEFKAYQLDDMQRQYQASIDGSIRDLAGAGQAEFVREHFLKLMNDSIRARKLKPVNATAFGALNRELDREVRRNLRQSVESWQEEVKDPAFKEFKGEEQSHINDYQKAARESQAQWLKFRDSCADLASALYRDQSGRFDPAVSMKAAVTKMRIAELRYNPIGPQNS